MAHKAHEYLNISNDIMTYTNKYTAVKYAAECTILTSLLLLLDGPPAVAIALIIR